MFINDGNMKMINQNQKVLIVFILAIIFTIQKSFSEIGIVCKEKDYIYDSYYSKEKSIVDSVELGDIFKTIGIKCEYYRQIMNEDSIKFIDLTNYNKIQRDKNTGWIECNSLKLFRGKNSIIDTAYFFYKVSRPPPGSICGVKREYDQNILNFKTALAHLILKRYPNQSCLAKESGFDTIHSGVEALNTLAMISVYKKEYSEAIGFYKDIVSKFPNTKSGDGISDGLAYEKIAQIYQRCLNEPKKAIETYQEIIKRYPNSIVQGFEWNSTLDINAVYNIKKIKNEFDWKKYGLNIEYFINEFHYSCSTSTSKSVKIIALIEKADLLLKINLSEKAIMGLLDIIKEYPNAEMKYYKTTVNHSISGLDKVVSIYYNNLKNHQQAFKTCDYFIDHKSEKFSLLGLAALFFKAELFEKNGENEKAIGIYKEFIEKSDKYWLVKSSIRKHKRRELTYVGTVVAKNKIAELQDLLIHPAQIKFNRNK